MERSCPRCKTTLYRNPTLKLVINECGHSLCTSCVQLLFIRGQAPCPECQMNLKKTAFREQMFDDPMIDREVHIRKGVLRIFNKREEEFSDYGEYDDYLEEIEDLVVALMEGENWAKEKLQKYSKDNNQAIRKNEALRLKEEETIVEQIEMEKRDIEKAKIKLAKMEADAEIKRIDEEKKLLAKIQAGEDLSTIIIEKEKLVNMEERIDEAEVTLAPLAAKITELFVYEPFEFQTLGPKIPEMIDMEALGYMDSIRQPIESQIASGYTAQLGLSRALNDCFSCLTWKSELTAVEFDPSLA